LVSARYRFLLRAVVITGGAGVFLASLLAFRFDHWPIYLTFLLISGLLFRPAVEVLPRLSLPIPEMAAIIGFLYIGGLPIAVLQILAPWLAGALDLLLPESWRRRMLALRQPASPERRELLFHGWRFPSAVRSVILAEQATFALGLGIRWAVVSALTEGGPPATADPGALAIAELAGYAAWGLLSLLPIFPDRSLIPLSSEGDLRTAFTDIGLVVVLALTPFVFLIAYGFQAHGLTGAAAWSLSTLGLHFMLARLNERRLTVERQNRRLESLNRELEQRERLSAIGKMSSVVSHQILQQLGVIGIYADLIRNSQGQPDDPAALEQARTNATAIEGALRDVNRVLEDLLVFSKDLKLNLYQHSLRRVIQECLDDCRAEADDRGVALSQQCSEDAVLPLDKLKMKQAINNVLRNAVEASPSGSRVSVSAGRRDGYVEVEVSDWGPGVADADREAIFTPFFTTKEQGTGLGLAIAREFAQAHGGELCLRSGPGGCGSTFVFRLPLGRP
jgi:signal transduction histidine kinase